MNTQKRQARAKARAKTMRLRRTGVPCAASKWGWQGTWNGDGLTPGEWQSARKEARRHPQRSALDKVLALVEARR